jgi:DNA topoisomerase-1
VRVEKARWGRHNIIKGKTKVELPKTVDVSDMTLEAAMAELAKKAPKKKAAAKKKGAKTTKKSAAKKTSTTKKAGSKKSTSKK